MNLTPQSLNFGNTMGGGIGAMNPMAALQQQAASGYQGTQTAPAGFSAPGSVSAPQIGGGGGGGGGSGLGFNIGTGQLVLGGIQAIGNLWAAWEAQKLAKEQFNFQKGITNTNLTNQIQSYNTSLADRINSRAFTEGRPEGYAGQYIDENKMVDTRNQ